MSLKYIPQIDEQPQTTLIVGAGAVENAWAPIIDIIKNQVPDDVELSPDIANCFFARIIYNMRFNAVSNAKENNSEYYTAIKSYYEQLKADISIALKMAQKNNTLKPRDELNTILSKFISRGRVATVNTNWDTVVDKAINSLYMDTDGSDVIVHHIHGSIDASNIIYFPSEVVLEPYRDKDDGEQLGTLHGVTWRVIENSTKLILYGISLDPLDAELIQTVAVGVSSPKLNKIVIINPDYFKVLQRVKALIDPRFPKYIECYHPANLDTQIIF